MGKEVKKDYEIFREHLIDKYGIAGISNSELYDLLIDCKNFKMRNLQKDVKIERDNHIREIHEWHATNHTMNANSSIAWLSNRFMLSAGTIQEILYAKRKVRLK